MTKQQRTVMLDEEDVEWLENHPEINFSALARQALKEQREMYEQFNDGSHSESLSEREIEKALKMYRSVKDKSGRPSKVEKWESRILDGSATLDDARDEMSKNTWYKLKKRVEE